MYNFIDCWQIILFTVYVILNEYKIEQIHANAAAANKTFIKTKKDIDMYDDLIEKDISIKIINVMMVILIYMKITNYARVYHKFGFLIKMITVTINNMRVFLCYYALYIIFFTYFYYILKVDPGNEQNIKFYPPIDYPALDKYFALFLMTLRNSIGDLASPDYSFWLEDKQVTVNGEEKTTTYNDIPVSKLIVIYLIWSFWVMQLLLMIIILLNFLIADIS